MGRFAQLMLKPVVTRFIASNRVRCCAAILVIGSSFTACSSMQPSASGTLLLDSPPPANFTHGLLPVREVSPLYPIRAKNLLVEGWARVQFAVNSSGHVVQNTIELVDSEPEGYFERTSIAAAREFEFDNFSGGLIRNVSYVFRFELEEMNRIGPDLSTGQPRVRELVSRRYITPQYPPAAIEQGIGGHVVVEFSVTTAGRVDNLIIVDSLPVGIFDEVALNAANRLLFEPRLIDGEPVTAENIQYRFDWKPPIP